MPTRFLPLPNPTVPGRGVLLGPPILFAASRMPISRLPPLVWRRCYFASTILVIRGLVGLNGVRLSTFFIREGPSHEPLCLLSAWLWRTNVRTLPRVILWPPQSQCCCVPLFLFHSQSRSISLAPIDLVERSRQAHHWCYFCL